MNDEDLGWGGGELGNGNSHEEQVMSTYYEANEYFMIQAGKDSSMVDLSFRLQHRWVTLVSRT